MGISGSGMSGGRGKNWSPPRIRTMLSAMIANNSKKVLFDNFMIPSY
jgi:hypothetical protein